MNIFDYTVQSSDEILKNQSVEKEIGLNKSTVIKRQQKYGLNKLDFETVTAWQIFVRQIKSSFIYLLVGAMIITLFLGEYFDALMIFIFIAINTVLGFFQEYHSEKTVKLLKKYTQSHARVIREEVEKVIFSEELVPGDIVIIETGDKVPSDLRLIEQTNLVIDETILTGESISVYKQCDTLDKMPKSYYQATNIAFYGTYVQKGRAKGIVVATGRSTVFGQIAKKTVETHRVSEFEKGIEKFSSFIFKLVAITVVIVFVANAIFKRGDTSIFELIIFIVALTISVIPEALPLVTTFSLARSARRLSQKKVIIKRLSSVEDLGGIEILCSDKTGTLTENKLTVADINSDNKRQILLFANMASAFEMEKKTEPFDIALSRVLTDPEKKQIDAVIKIDEEPFDPKTKKNIVYVQAAGTHFLITRGAPEEIMRVCSDVTQHKIEQIKSWIAKEGKKGHRVLAVAYKEIKNPGSRDESKKILGKDGYIFSGVISFVDPIKPSTMEAALKAKKLGVRMIVITGDSKEVAGAVGCEIGLIDAPHKVISGEEFEEMSDEQKIRCLDENSIFARISPEQKYKILESLQKNHAIGFLGEGINDVPALKIAGVSLVVDSASDVARETADIILLKKDLKVIMDGIEEGRKVFANTKKYLTATLASNFGNFFAVAFASLIITFLPMLPIQILLLNLLSDTPMISVSTDNVDHDELTTPKKYEAKEIIVLAMILGGISLIFDFIFFGLFYKNSPEILQTNWFIGSILTELILIYSIRTRFIFFKGSRPSKSLTILSIIIVCVTFILPFSVFGQKVFHFVPPTMEHLMWIFAVVLTYFICTECAKLVYYRQKLKKI